MGPGRQGRGPGYPYMPLYTLIRRHPWLSSVWKQPMSPEPMEPECNKPMNHCSHLVKGMTTVANWLRVVTPYPLGTQSGPLRLPYGSLMPPFWLPYAPLLVPFRPPLGCANVARPRDDFH